MKAVFVRCSFIALLSISGLASAQTAWPDNIATYKAGWSNSPVPAKLPPNVVQTTIDPSTASGKAVWAGQWQGWGGRGRSTDYKVVITDVTDIGATIDYAVASASLAPFYARVNGRFVGDELQGFVGSSATIAFRMRASGELEFLWTRGEAWQAGVFTKVP